MFALSKIFWVLLRPDSLLIFLLLAAVGLLWRGRLRAGRLLATLAACLWLAVATLPVDAWLLRPLENRFPEPQRLPVDPEGIIILGGWQELAISTSRELPELNDAADRMLRFVDLARRYPHARLVVTGGSGLIASHGLNECDVAREAFTRIGFDDSRVIYECRSRNTWENAKFSKEAAHPSSGRSWLLVTSAYHMPRSVGVFREFGWTVTVCPADFRTPLSGGAAFQDSIGLRLDKLDKAAREWVGLAAYRVMGRTRELFPSSELPAGGDESVLRQ